MSGRSFIAGTAGAAVTTALMLSGCSSPGPDKGVTPNTPDPLTATAPASTSATTAPLVTATSSNLQYPWKLLGVSADGKNLTIRYLKGDGSCETFTGLHVVQSSARVVITVLGREHDASSNVACPDVLYMGTGDVPLRAPLGSRQLVHGPVTRSWSHISF